jgi:ribose-phosphate pyrophosphokinase
VDVHGQDVYVVQSLCGDAHASANDKLCRLLFFAGALKDAGARRVIACVPYLAYARKDRRTQPRDPVTTRYVAALFAAMGIDGVIVVDVHNDAAFDNAFACPTVRLQAAEVFVDRIATLMQERPLVIGSPDIGGVKRAQLLRETFASRTQREIGFAFVEKRRARGVVSGDLLVGPVAGSDVLFYDDMIVSGGTILRAVEAARAAGAVRVLVAAPHAAFQPGALRLFDRSGPDHVLVSDTIPLTAPFDSIPAAHLVTCSVAPLFARTIADLSQS